MSYRVIKGEFHIWYPDQILQGPEPDGDTIKFKPDQASLVHGLERSGGRAPEFNERGMINIRFEGIDALETHFQGRHQNDQWSHAAKDRLLGLAGFTHVQFHPENPLKVSSATPQYTRGHILARSLDPFGRIIAFVYPGEPSNARPGEHLTPDKAVASINGILLSEGLCYPSFYSTLPTDIRDRYAQIAVAARNGARGLWPEDTASVTKEANIANLAALEKLVIWPKLFRRLAAYFQAGFTSLEQFDAWLREDQVNRDDNLLFLDNGQFANMHDLVTIVGSKVKMTRSSELIVIKPDPTTPWTSGAPGRGAIMPLANDVRIIAVLAKPTTGGKETVTLVNLSAATISIQGWQLIDRTGTSRLLDGSLHAGEFKSIEVRPDMSLNDSGDTVRLVNAVGEIIHEITYTANQVQVRGRTVTFA